MSLFIVATPIGNLGDITLRAIETLQKADIVAAEDTRTALKLFSKFDIHAKLVAFHAHSSERELEKILTELKAGKSVALISEAGTPGISDPGFALIRKAIEEKIEVVPIPGACAAIAALSASGLRMDKFIFLGFLPLKKGRAKLIESLRDRSETIIFYESPHRIQKTISQMAEILGGARSVVFARELTKIHEEFFRGNLTEASEFLQSKPIRGEFTILLGA
ncbi:MAG: 16S rRNA (cytidine(1402)-2'-O)-methyltransferase [Patescibacteria group bacterium]|jgi:16S rRNA (cytidine1402-2'-O)-methyltransferase